MQEIDKVQYQDQGQYPVVQGIPMMQQQVILVQQGIPIVQDNIPRHADGLMFPATIQCPYCGRTARTRVETKVGSHTWIIGIILFLFFLPLMWIPFCMQDCKDRQHYCSQCNKKVGLAQYQLC